MVSPNMTYPKAIKAAAQKVIDGAPARLAPISEALASGDAARVAKAERDKKALDGAVARARDDLDRFRNDNTSMVGLEKPLFDLKNPGLISIPLGFLAVVLGSLLYRDKRAEEMWDELYVRQNTGILAAKAHAH
jgi:cation/acetate symporter